MRTKRYKNERREKFIGIRFSLFQFFFCWPEVVKIFTTVLCLIEFHSIYKTSCRKIDFLTILSNFYAFVQFFFQILVNFFLQILVYGTVIQ